LLQYIVSFRNHNDFHEQCVERIYMDIWMRCKPTKLSVYARYTRRGGLDINPFRTSHPQQLHRKQAYRQTIIRKVMRALLIQVAGLCAAQGS